MIMVDSPIMIIMHLRSNNFLYMARFQLILIVQMGMSMPLPEYNIN